MAVRATSNLCITRQRRFKVGYDLSYHRKMLDTLLRQSVEGVALLIDWDIHAEAARSLIHRLTHALMTAP